MLGDGHVRFGRRPRETDRPQGRHRALGRPHSIAEHAGDRDPHGMQYLLARASWDTKE